MGRACTSRDIIGRAMSQRQSRGSRDSRDNPSVPKALTRKDINEQADRTVNDAVKKLNQKEDATTPQSALIRRLDLRCTWGLCAMVGSFAAH